MAQQELQTFIPGNDHPENDAFALLTHYTDAQIKYLWENEQINDAQVLRYNAWKKHQHSMENGIDNEWENKTKKEKRTMVLKIDQIVKDYEMRKMKRIENERRFNALFARSAGGTPPPLPPQQPKPTKRKRRMTVN